MKRIFLTAFIMLTSILGLMAQNDENTLPAFPGGVTGMYNYVSTNTHYPESAREWTAQARIIVTYVVDKEGNVTEPRVTNVTDLSLDSHKVSKLSKKEQKEVTKTIIEDMKTEALRVVAQMPKWTPGKQKGEPIRVRLNVPVTF